MNEIVAIVNKLIERHGGLAAASRALRIDKGLLSRIRAGKQGAGPSTLRKLGLEKQISYKAKA